MSVDSTSRPPLSAEPFVFEQLEAHGELVVSGSPSDRAAEIVAEARVRATEIEEEARQAGFETGRVEGVAAAEAELAELRRTLETAVAGVLAARDEFVAAAELHAIELAIAVAEKIVSATLSVEPQRVCDLVAGALRRVADRDRLVLELNPDDVEIVRGWLESGEASFWSSIDIRAERRVAQGGCIVRTSEGEIDARVAEQLAAAEQILRDTYAERGA